MEKGMKGYQPENMEGKSLNKGQCSSVKKHSIAKCCKRLIISNLRDIEMHWGEKKQNKTKSGYLY